jgi:hypothetical protein
MLTAALLAALCLAQAPAEPSAKPAPPEAPSKSTATFVVAKPVSAAPAAKPEDKAKPSLEAPFAVVDVGDGTARIGRAIIARDLEALVLLTPAPFSFDGVVAKTPAEVRQHWAETLDRHPVERLRLFGIEVLSYGAMVEKYGPPPARLSSVNLKDTKIGIANLSGRATLVAWKHKAGSRLTAVAISD